MSNHQASEQMLGYLYQVRCALKLLLENDNSEQKMTKKSNVVEGFLLRSLSKYDILQMY